MAETAQHSVNGLAEELEPHAVESWPARETVALDGWLLRFTSGFSSRANSVSVLAYFGSSLDRSIEAVEAAYLARGLPPQFQISPASRPVQFEDALRARGYAHKSPTILMVADVDAVAAESDVAIASVADADFERLTREGSHSPADGDERLSILARVTHPKAFFTAFAGGAAVSCGASVVTGDWASVYVMRTTPGHRRRGHRRRILRAIAAWARSQGATRLYLQVDEANEAGRALYQRAGFQDGYVYLHYVAADRSRDGGIKFTP